MARHPLVTAAGQVRKVWETPGPRLDIHREAQRQIITKWPLLFRAIEDLILEHRRAVGQ